MRASSGAATATRRRAQPRRGSPLLLRDPDHGGERRLRLAELARVDQRVREQHREAQLLDRRAAPRAPPRRARLEERDRRLERRRSSHRRGRACRPRPDRRACSPPRSAQRLLEQLDRLVQPLGAECDLPEPGKRRRARRVAGLEMRAKEPLGLLDLAEPQRDLGLDQLGRLGARPRRRRSRATGPRRSSRERELVDHLERRDARARLETRDVGGGAAGERELALREPGALRAPPSGGPDLARRVDVGGQ